MFVAGIDAGQSTIKVAIISDDKVLSSIVLQAGGESTEVMAELAFKQAVEEADISTNDVKFIMATGSGRKYITFAQQQSPELACVAKQIYALFPTAASVIDIGAQKCLALNLNDGNPLDFAMNDKCAAGSGIFLEKVASMLRLNIDEIGPVSLQTQEELEVTNTCAVFAESDIISHVHAKKQIADILMAVFNGLALRAYAIMTRIGINEDVVMIGGVARNVGVVKALEGQIGTKLLIPENPQIVGAVGAALMAKQVMEGE